MLGDGDGDGRGTSTATAVGAGACAAALAGGEAASAATQAGGSRRGEQFPVSGDNRVGDSWSGPVLDEFDRIAFRRRILAIIEEGARSKEGVVLPPRKVQNLPPDLEEMRLKLANLIRVGIEQRKHASRMFPGTKSRMLL